ncbi:MAG: OmpA family protein [Bacteroidota bacterium]
MQFRLILISSLLLGSMTACVSSKKLKSATAELEALGGKYKTLQSDLDECATEKATLARQKEACEREKALMATKVNELTDQVEFLKQTNNQAIKQLETMSVISSQQAESIRKSMENMGMKDAYIQTLQQQMARKDSMNMALVMNLKGAIGNLDDQDINIKVDKGVVYIDISDKLLFTTGSYDITEKAKGVLEKVAMVLKNQPDLEFMVEGHTDNIAFSGSGPISDNWDLSVKRATTVVRLLQKQYGLDPAKMVAAGRGEFSPIADNTTKEGRSANRRTRIVVLPQLDQFFKLLETSK